MTRMDKYGNYSAIQLATDPTFISWVKCPDEETGLIWKEFINKYPGQLPAVIKAKSIVSQMGIEEVSMDESRAIAIWNNIAEGIKTVPVLKMNTSKMGRQKYWMAAAAALLITVVGAWFWLGKNEPLNRPVAISQQVQDIAPGGNKAILTLSDGTKLVLDSTNSGTITTQGNVTIIKLNDGRLAYEASTTPSQPLTIKYNTITTPRGGQYQIVLSDGSMVWINAASSITYPTAFTGNQRKVSMTGEAYFEIAHNEKMPFIVSKGNVEIKVLGTHFNVNAYDDVKVTLLEGAVRVSSRNEYLNINKPGQQATAGESALVLSNNVNLEEVMAWKNGKFYFNRSNIRSVMEKISRWYDVDVEYRGNVNKVFFGTVPRDINVSDIFKILEATGGVHFKIEENKIIVSP